MCECAWVWFCPDHILRMIKGTKTLFGKHFHHDETVCIVKYQVPYDKGQGHICPPCHKYLLLASKDFKIILYIPDNHNLTVCHVTNPWPSLKGQGHVLTKVIKFHIIIDST